MDKTTKTVLILIGSVFVLCACAAIAAFAIGLWSFVNVEKQNVGFRPQEAVRVGYEIADFEVPAGFDSPYSVHFGDVTMVGYDAQNERSHLLLAQFPKGTSINTQEMLKIIQKGRGDPDSIWYNTNVSLIEEKPVTIRGQETTLSISEGTSSDGISYRSATATFEGRNGPALVLIASPVEEWDITMVETFMASIQ